MDEKPAEPARVGWGPNEFTSLGRGGACLPDDKVKELSIYRQLLTGTPGATLRPSREARTRAAPRTDPKTRGGALA